MLVIRQSQIEELAKVGISRFIERITVHVHEVWPGECSRLGEAATRQIVQSSVERAMAYKMATEYDVARFVDLAFAFESPDFDQAAWATPILQDDSQPPRRRMNRLWEEARRHLGKS
jgi:hypothetical protein